MGWGKQTARGQTVWLTKFIRTELHDFHTIKTKPIALQRVKEQHGSVTNNWFEEYSQFLLAHKIS